MMVEVVDPIPNKDMQRFKGRVAKVIKYGPDNDGHWILDIPEKHPSGINYEFHSKCLRPIEDDNASWDAEVWEQIGWKPKGIEA
jgi:hypothetical protein